MKLSVIILLVSLLVKPKEGTALLRGNNDEARELKKDEKKKNVNSDDKISDDKKKNDKKKNANAKKKDTKFRPNGQGATQDTTLATIPQTSGTWKPGMQGGSGIVGTGFSLNANDNTAGTNLIASGTSTVKPTTSTVTGSSQGNGQESNQNTAGMTVVEPTTSTVTESSQGNAQVANQNYAALGFDVAPEGCTKANKPNWEWKNKEGNSPIAQMYQRIDQCKYDEHCASGCCMIYQLGWKCCQEPLSHMACAGSCAAKATSGGDETIYVNEKPGKL